MGDPFADVARHDLIDSHRAEPRHDVLVNLIGVTLPGGHLDHMVWQPLLFDIPREGLLPASRVADSALSLLDLSGLPSLVCIPLIWEGPRRTRLPAKITIVGRVSLSSFLVATLP